MTTPISTEIEESSRDFPILGYTVIAALQGVEIEHTSLLKLLISNGFGQHLPPVREPGTTLRRAMSRWIKSLSKTSALPTAEEDDDEDKKTKRLIREIASRKKDVLTFALVTENINLRELGLTYLTDLRVFLDKKTMDITLTTRPEKGTIGSRDRMTQSEQDLLDSLLPYWHTYKDVHLSGDLSRMLRDIITNMNATSMRTGGGVYFVPFAEREQLARLKNVIENLPATPGGENTSSLTHIPVIDTKTTKAQLATLAHRSFLAEVAALQKELHTFIVRADEARKKNRQPRISTESMLAHIERYKGIKAKAELYNQALDMRQQEIITNLDALQQSARELIEMATTEPEGETIENAEDQTAEASLIQSSDE